MTEIGAIILSGESIPDDVIRVTDRERDSWSRVGDGVPGGVWQCDKGQIGDVRSGEVVAFEWGPLTVTAVREQPVEPATWHAFMPGGADPERCKKVVFGSMFCGYGPADFPHRCRNCGQPLSERACGPTHAMLATWDLDELITQPDPICDAATCEKPGHHHGADIPTLHVNEIFPPEPQQVDTSALLDLVRQYGNAFAQLARTLGDLFPIVQARDFVDYEEEAREAQALFARITALLPQQPVQARSGHELLWQHGCEQVRIDVNQPGPFDCGTLGCTGPWRPLLVGGDPEPCVHLAVVHGLTVERDEARAEVERLRVEHRNGDGCSHFDRLLSVLDAENLRQALAEIERLKAAQPDPLVLSLPEVDPQATLIGGARWVPHSMPGWWVMEGGSLPHELGTVLDYEEGTVRVEMDPPREPRTWPKLDGPPDGVRKVRVKRGNGPGFVVTRRRDNLWAEGIDRAPDAVDPSQCYRWGELLDLGELTEVFDDEPGGRP